MNIRDIRWAAGVSSVMLLTVPFVLLPLRVATWVGGNLGLALYYFLGKWRFIGDETVAAMLPYLQAQNGWDRQLTTPERITREVFINIGILVSELSRLYYGLDKSLLRTVEFRGIEHYERAKARGRGILFITAHCGNWELMALAFGAAYSPVAVVARHMKKGYVNKLLEKIRLRHGNSVIYRDKSVREILTCLKANGTVGILIDQVTPPPHGILADFFGRPAWTTLMPVKVAMKSKGALLPIFIHREEGRSIVTIHPEVEVKEEGSDQDRILDGTLRLNNCLEQHILRYPTQWNWLYRRWKGTDGVNAGQTRKE
jgi:Kdo2-lipid IVA lauroyltransferase/acyltransferase